MAAGYSRRRPGRTLHGWLVAAAAFGLALAGPAQSEREGVIAAADLVDPSLLVGPGFRVDPQARFSGLQAHFRIVTDWGVVEAESVEMLAVRIDEMAAVEALYAHDFTTALGRAGLDELQQPIGTATALGRSPMQRAKRLPAGILRYFNSRLQRWSDRARKLGHRLDTAISHEGSPYDRQELPGAVSAVGTDEPWWDKPVDELGRLLRSEAGHGPARRELARAFGVQSWTSNPLLRQRLDALAWAIAGQRLAMDYALQLAAPGLAGALSELSRVDQLTTADAQTDLRRPNEEQLGHWTADPELAYALAWRGSFPPALLEQLIGHLTALAPSAGGEAFLEVARMAGNEIEARFVLNSLQLLRARCAPGGRFVAVGALAGYLDSNGEFFLPVPVDRLSWVSGVRTWFDHARVVEHTHRTVLLSGEFSPAAERALTRRGWSLLPRVTFPGSPPYRLAGSNL